MRRWLIWSVLALLAMPSVVFAQEATPGASPAALPLGVPAAAKPATVSGIIDGDKIDVQAPDGAVQVLLAGIDAPESDECFFQESTEYLADLLPVGTIVYLEQSGTADEYGSLRVRYVWLPGSNGAKALLINTKMVRDGYAGFDDGQDSPKYFDNLEKAELDARIKGRGLWDVCHTLHISAAVLTPEPTSPPKPTPTPRPEPTPTEAPESGVSGYSSGIGQSRADWERVHGSANPNVSFPGFEVYGYQTDYSFIVSYINGNVWNLTYQVPNIPFSTAEDLAAALIPPDSILVDEYYPQTFSTVRVYNSQSLIPRLEYADFDVWMGEAPGTFIVIFNYDEVTREVFSIVVAPGNNP